MLSMPYKRNGEEHVVDPRGAAHLDCFWSGWSGVRSGVVSRPLWCSRGLTCIASRNHRTDATVVSFFGSRAGHVLAGICARACNSSPVHRIVKFRSLAPILVRWVATLRSTSITLWFNVMLQHCRIPNLVFRVSLVRWTHFHTLFLYSRSSWLQPCEPRRTLYVHGHRLFVPGGPQHQVLGSRARRHGGILRHDVSCVCQRREHCGGEHRVSRLGRHAVSQSDAHKWQKWRVHERHGQLPVRLASMSTWRFLHGAHVKQQSNRPATKKGGHVDAVRPFRTVPRGKRRSRGIHVAGEGLRL
mmetsp:Transcript_1003/g.6282  ORF Transcript_1003/g.6282 Transcript_1003/m.6282 type:complete len:300 (+) Transcript_1003:2010-2909(+)